MNWVYAHPPPHVGAPPALPVRIARPPHRPIPSRRRCIQSARRTRHKRPCPPCPANPRRRASPACPSSRSRVIPRSCKPSPSCSHFFAIEVVSIGQSSLVSIQSLNWSRICDLRRYRCLVSRTSRSVEPEMRCGFDQVSRVKLLGAIVALIAARTLISAIRAGALDIAIR